MDLMKEYQKFNAPNTTVTRDMHSIEYKTGNVYQSLAIIGKRANQISTQLKQELDGKLEEFASVTDSLEEIFENREQIEISKMYERMPSPVILAVEEFLEDKIYHRQPEAEQAPSSEE